MCQCSSIRLLHKKVNVARMVVRYCAVLDGRVGVSGTRFYSGGAVAEEGIA